MDDGNSPTLYAAPGQGREEQQGTDKKKNYV
jgi:hypothetical protein